jgi:hypothetical protein
LAVLAGALAAPTAATASTTEAIADTGGMTLDLDGWPSLLDVSITLDDLGHITEVVVGDEPVEGDGDHRVRFSNIDDTTRVAVQAKNHKLSADVKAGALADLVGPHLWSAPLFGSLNDSVVPFEVTDDGAGNPGLVIGDISTDDGVEVDIGDVETEVEGDEAEAQVKINFTYDGYTMTLKIQVSVESEDDDDEDDDRDFSAKLKVVLRGKDVQELRRQALDDIAREHLWDGHLCDGTPVTVGWLISDQGEISKIEVTPTDSHEVKTMPHGFSVKWNDSKAKVTVELKEKEDGTWDLKVRSKSTDKCNDHDDDDKEDEEKERGRRDKDKKKDKDDDDDEDNQDDD